jgi:hypothetical protein
VESLRLTERAWDEVFEALTSFEKEQFDRPDLKTIRDGGVDLAAENSNESTLTTAHSSTTTTGSSPSPVSSTETPPTSRLCGWRRPAFIRLCVPRV